MMIRRSRPALGSLFFLMSMLLLALYFAFAAVQGNFGVLRRAEVRAEVRSLQEELAEIKSEVARMENLTRRLDDNYLDLDLLDERARTMLGMIRYDEIVIR